MTEHTTNVIRAMVPWGFIWLCMVMMKLLCSHAAHAAARMDGRGSRYWWRRSTRSTRSGQVVGLSGHGLAGV